MLLKILFFLFILLFTYGCDASFENSNTAATSQPSIAGTLIPLYSHPTHESWNTLAELNTSLETIVIINPDNGPVECNTTMSSDYIEGIAKLKSASIKVIGYVSTQYAARSIDLVKADVALYYECFSNLDGIFFDEANSFAGSAEYYANLYTFVKETNSSQKVVLNPGTYPDEAIVQASDIVIVYENAGPNFDLLTPPSYISKYNAEKFALIGYDVLADSLTIEKLTLDKIGYIYLTDDTLDNPWDTLSSYYPSLMELLGSLNK